MAKNRGRGCHSLNKAKKCILEAHFPGLLSGARCGAFRIVEALWHPSLGQPSLLMYFKTYCQQRT